MDSSSSISSSSSSSFSSSSSCFDAQQLSTTTTTTTTDTETSSFSISRALSLVKSDGRDSKLEGARQIRRLTKTSQKCRRLLSDSVAPLTDMLRLADSPESNESALLALLNLAVKDEMNKSKIIEAGALEPIISFLTSENSNLQEYAAASLYTLSASVAIRPIIGAAPEAIPLLVDTLRRGSPQAKDDAVMALANLSTFPDNLVAILKAEPVPWVVDLLKACKKSSKAAENCCALAECLMGFDEARVALTQEDGGVLAVVEALESGSLASREHAVGALLAMCESDRHAYREPILREGVIPGLLEMTVQGSAECRTKAQTLLRLLRESPYPRSELQADTLENIVCNIISQIDGEDRSGKARKMLAEMVQVSMEQSLRHLQQRALICTPTDIPITATNCNSQVSSK